jgi:hypothetical protein
VFLSVKAYVNKQKLNLEHSQRSVLTTFLSIFILLSLRVIYNSVFNIVLILSQEIYNKENFCLIFTSFKSKHTIILLKPYNPLNNALMLPLPFFILLIALRIAS